jgi:hypothetical protein
MKLENVSDSDSDDDDIVVAAKPAASKVTDSTDPIYDMI